MKSKSLKILFVLALAVLLIPYPTTSVPEWKVRVIDKTGNPVENAQVRQVWSHGQGEHTDDQISDEQGFVVFPARTKILPLILRIPLRTIEYLEHFIMPHGASIGSKAYIWSFNPTTDTIYYYEGGEIKDTLVKKY